MYILPIKKGEKTYLLAFFLLAINFISDSDELFYLPETITFADALPMRTI